MTVVGITGFSGAGKSTLSGIFARHGALVLDADAIYHRLLAESAALRNALTSRFGEEILTGGRIDRRKLAPLVFSSPERLEDLNRITHPFVAEEIRKALESGPRLAAVDAPLLFESGLSEICDLTAAVLAARDVRIRRIMLRDGISQEAAEARVNAQKDASYYIGRSDVVLWNDRDEESFRREGSAFFKALASPLFALANRHKYDKDRKGQEDMDELNEVREKLLAPKKRRIEDLKSSESIEITRFAEGYMAYLDAGKTEREASREAIRLAAEKGFEPYDPSSPAVPGKKYYVSFGDKMTILFTVGKRPLSAGVNIVAAHIDSPRLDLKPNPLYQESDAAYFKTHYYGGIRKYQWMTIPLALHGVAVKPDGEKIDVVVGEDEGDPVFSIPDLLPHLAREQGSKPLNSAYTGESLNPILGTLPYAGEGEDRVKLAVMSLFNDRFGITEEDFLSSEISLVPAGKARSVGIDESMVGSYGQDDRVCAYGALRALLDLEEIPERTAMVVLADKEEIGSEGLSGMKSAKFDHLLAALSGNDLGAYHALLDSSFCLSCDVAAAYDPGFAEAYEKKNAAFLNGGVAICKYTGSGGKSGSNDASAETVGTLRRIFAENGVAWQLCELGKVDVGGGGTVAKFMSERGIETIDAGTPVLSMHSPFELTAKYDVYHTYRAALAVFTL